MPLRKHEYHRPSKEKELDEIVNHHKSVEKYVTDDADSRIDWSNLIFLPFHPVFKIFVLLSVFIKTILGPIQSVYPIVYCSDTMDHNPILLFIKYCYWYYSDLIYGIDTFLHIVHRQVTDKAMRREHMPKSAGFLLLDILALIPFFRLTEQNPCPPTRLWPNILANNEFLVIYRVTEYFRLVSTHSYWNLMIGYSIVLFVTINCVTCFWILLTEHGLCEQCRNHFYDWRASILYKMNETDFEQTTFVYGFVFVYSFSLHSFFDNECKPSALLEFMMIALFMLAGYILNNFVVLPKAYAEAMFRLRRVCLKYPRVQKILADMKRRNPSGDAHIKVENYYKLLWRRRSGITDMPPCFKTDIPRYLRLEIWQDLLWPLFFHSPTLRKTTFPFRRWITEGAIMSYKLPGEKFFKSSEGATDVYYLKSGVVQLISLDDGVTPILSVTGGTIFGDVNFLIPHVKRKVIVRCLTYCEVYSVKRKYLISSLHKYPLDRVIVRRAVSDRLTHAKALFANKLNIRGLDRNEDEGIAWLKRRWWEIHDTVDKWSKKTGKSMEHVRCELPREDTSYHCAKYIGQLCLCTPTQLKTKSMFVNFKFPWILNPYSKFGAAWHKVVSTTVFLVLLVYPQHLVRSPVPAWFHFFSYWTDLIYVLDIIVSLFTAVKTSNKNFATVLFERWKCFTFLLDLMATIWLEDIAIIVGHPKYYYTLQFNRLIKVYILFHGSYVRWDIRKNPLIDVCRKIFLLHLSHAIIMSHIVFEMTCYIPTISVTYFFGKVLCSRVRQMNCDKIHSFFGVTVAWAFEWTFSENVTLHLIDSYIGIVVSYSAYLLFIYCKGRFMAYLYLKNKDISKYQNFVVNLKKYYENYRIHPDLVKRLDRYFKCHWKYFKGADVMFSNTLLDEPLEVYWKAQGNVARKIISESKGFEGADRALIKELACAAKFLIMPKQATIFMFGGQCKNVMWIVQGFIKSEYYDDHGEKLLEFYGPGSMLSVSAVFFEKVSLRSYTAFTDCEILYIPMNQFFEIYKRYSYEYSYLQTCVKEFGPSFDALFKKYVLKHKDYQTKLRDKLYSARMSMVTSGVIADIEQKRSLPFEGEFWGTPESGFFRAWLLFRSMIVCLSIVSSSVLGGVGSGYRWVFMMFSSFCDCICWIDIIMKLFLTYHNKDGILITSRKKCLLNYLTKGFTLDVIGAIPWFEFLKAVLSEGIDNDTCLLINTICKFAHIYIVFAYFEYITDIPTAKSTFLNTLKWQIVNILIVLASSHYFMVKCVTFEYNDKMDLIHAGLRNECWVPDFMELPSDLSWDEMHLIFAHSLSFAECGMLSMNFGRYIIDRNHYGIGLTLFLLGIVFWFITCYTLTLLVLNARGDTVFQHHVHQLESFLNSERIEKDTIKKVMEHFRYSWIRTKGTNIEKLMEERIGVVFRQDMNFYFYKKTLTIMDSIIKGGEQVQRQIANYCTQAVFLPGYDIFREMDLVDHICIVHRGKVAITKGGKKLINLTKGDMFGQLTQGTRLRPVRVTATSIDSVDLLYVDFKTFHSIITKKVKLNIMRNPHHKNDFLATKNVVAENPYDTVEYLLRGRKIIQLPWVVGPSEANHGTWYTRWLYATWLFSPTISTFLIMVFYVLPSDSHLLTRIYYVLIFLDILHFAQFLTEFYAMELAVMQNKCVYRRVGVTILKHSCFYIDIFSLVIPPFTILTGRWECQMARFVRLKYFYDYEVHFCRTFKSQVAPVLLKLTIFCLLIHSFACGWVHFACRGPVKFPLDLGDMSDMNDTIDFTTWMHPLKRGEGCVRSTKNIYTPATEDTEESYIPTFVVPIKWEHDYIIALTFVLIIHTHTAIDTILPMNISQVYYKVFVTFFMYLIDVYIMSFAMNAAYTKFQELYQYDYGVDSMLTYLSDCGLCKSLVESVLQYTAQLWQRDKGDKLPEIAYQGPSCLRQDLFTALYIHHLEAAPTFRALPFYFKRQLAARFQRTVIFPGKCIVREGDTFNITYFIHAGEVEKWYVDENGDSKLLSVLYTNGYFGCVAGLFVNVGFQFSYYSRTVVDLVYLNRDKWNDLLEGYPDIKAKLYETTKNLKKEYAKQQYGRSQSVSGVSSTTLHGLL